VKHSVALLRGNCVGINVRGNFRNVRHPLHPPTMMVRNDGTKTGPHDSKTGPYYPLGAIGTVPRAYDILGPTKASKGEK
jgi:hypothetical protein